MRLYMVETPAFDFHIFANDDVELCILFGIVWKQHCEDCKMPFEHDYFQTLVEEHSYIEVQRGYCYKDKERVL